MANLKRFVVLSCITGIALAAGALVPSTANAAGDLCGECDIAQLKKDYIIIYDKATKLYGEVAEDFKEVADDYQDALNAAIDLAGLPDLPSNPEEACDAIVDLMLGSLGTAATALSGLGSALGGLVGEGDAADDLGVANATAGLARRTKACIDECCNEAKAAKENKLVEENPDVDFMVKLSKEEMDRCLQKLSSGDLRDLAGKAKGGSLDDSFHRGNIDAIIEAAK